jgi:AAA15 family ATPase/GTPase
MGISVKVIILTKRKDNKMVYLIIRKYQYKDQEPTYRVEKWSKTIKEANQYLSALSLLENDEYVMFFIVPAQENPALVLTEEVA